MRKGWWWQRGALVLLLGMVLPRQTASLTIYRIGGEGVPRPELDAPFDFVQIPWAATEPKRYGSNELIQVTEKAITPQELDPSINLVPLLKRQGGQVLSLTWIGWNPASGRDLDMFDSDPNTAFLGDGDWGGDYGVIKNKSVIFDLGGRYLIDRIRFYPRQRFLADRFVEHFIIGTNDGDPLKDGTRAHNFGGRGGAFDFDVAYEAAENTKAMIELPMPRSPIRHLLFEAPENTRGIWELAEFEIYGTGYVPAASYVSNVIDLGSAASLGQIAWKGRQDQGAEVALSMRSGEDEEPNTYWRYTFRGDERSRFDAAGKPLILATYNKLESAEKAGVTHDTEHWEFWSSTYDFGAGQGALSAAEPRRYLQFRADFASTEKAGGQLDYLEFAVSIPPVASAALAEIYPQAAQAGTPTLFTYKLRPRIKREDLGFDSIEIDTPARPLGVEGVRLSGVPVDYQVVRLDDRGLTVQFSRVGPQQTGELVEVDFRAEVFKYGTLFPGRIYDSARPLEVHQALTAGDADNLADSNTLTVGLSSLDGRNIQSLRVAPGVFTPNGDGVNDQVEVRCDLLNLAGAVPVHLGIYELSGRRVGMIEEGPQTSGRLALRWDGRGAAGALLAPGIYVLHLEVEADKGLVAADVVVSLVY
ncbi:MAG: hypothetical protein EXS58_10810 [Candidatus Latescibacteria bacterium]|nr:hypothetical protein [Candidatus Latescibacterota bacterium]